MKYYNKIVNIIFFKILLLFSNTIFAQANCEDPLSFEWLQFSIGNTCVEGIYAFEYDDDPYVYVVSKPECIAADAGNTLYNCTEESFCYYFGFTLPEYQCDESLIDAITPYLTIENLIYPLPNNSRTCANPLQLLWVQESINIPCTDGIYTFDYNGNSYIYRSTACEYIDDVNRLYNCDDKSTCFVDGRTFPEDRCDLTEFPLDDFLINRNLIWSSPLLRLLPEYPWLTEKVDFGQCDDVKIKEFKTTNDSYLSVKNKNVAELYAQNGVLLCTNTNNSNCETAYGLISPNEEWACNARIDPTIICGIDEPQDSLPWLQELINSTTCDCNASIIQYCYDGEVYFDSTPVDPGYCADYASFIYDVEGNVVCQNGGITGGNCHEILYDFYNSAENIGLVWSCDNQNTSCETLQFASINSGCECCNDIILFEITGGDGNYEVTTLDGQVVTNGMGVELLSIGANELVVTDGQGCTTTGIFQNFPFCCEAPPVCEDINVSYSCVNGLQINGYGGDCNSVPVKDQNGNTFYHGDLLEDGEYIFTEANQGQVSPPCSVNNVTVNCSEDSVCNLPPDSGPCEAYIPRYYYDADAKECMQFIYGGCQGNDNNYETYEICTGTCGYNYTCPSIEDPLEELAWLQKIAQNANGCSVKEIAQFTYNSNIYFKTTPHWGGNFCPSDLPVHYYNCEGLRLCSQGFTPFPTCNQAMVDAANATSSIIWTYSDEDCNNLQFDYIQSECSACCDETLSFAISGGDGNYEVTTTDGLTLYNGMPLPLDIVYYGSGFTLIVTDGQGCTAEQYFDGAFLCCEVPPNCYLNDITYDCNEGLQINADGDCSEALFTDEAGNTYESGSVLADGNYTLISGGHPISPNCSPFELTVNCEDHMSYCDFEDVLITSNPEICGLSIVELATNDVFGNAGPDDGEIVFVKVSGDNTFEVLDDLFIYDSYPCYYAVAYRSSCDVPDFYTNSFNDVLNNAGTYKVSACFTLDYLQAPEFEVTTEPYCNGEGKFTVGITISGGSASYIVGKDYTGENVYGETGENFITFASGEEFYDIYPTDAETGCANDYIISVNDPGCGVLNICELPVVVGPCEAATPRYYYDTEQGDCIEFFYGGCEGNANNFETYIACLEACGTNCDCPAVYEPVCGVDGVTYGNECEATCEGVEVAYEGECNSELDCPPGEPIDWVWMQELIVKYGGCDIFEIKTFTYQGTPHFATEPGYPSNLLCATDAPYNYYNCEGDLICRLGFFHPDYEFLCEPDVQIAASDATTIWTYNETNCSDPFELEMVQQAIENETCTEGIYAFDFDGESFVYIKGLCGRFIDGASDALYNCNTGLTCLFSYYGAYSNACDNLFNEVSQLVNEEYLIWSPGNSCGCDADYTPVCGVDGNTYSNACVAECEGAEIAYEGECEEPCICPAIYEPVCGVDGVTYGNECEATCEGVEIAYEGECIGELDCLTSDPLQWLWMQNLIIKDGGCLISEIREFTYQRTPHYVTIPGYPPNLNCPTDAPWTYYNCEGEFVCEIGFFSPDTPTFCNDDILSAADDAKVIWTYNETNCANPFELELVKNAVADETCTGGIYAFGFEGESFIYIQTLCEFIDAPNLLYNCNTGISCAIGGETIYVEACYKTYDAVSDLINDENLIWTKPCEYETRAMVTAYDCGLVLEAADDLILEPEVVPDGFTFTEGQTVEFTYRKVPVAPTCSFAEKAEIICIREVDEGCPCNDVYEPVCGEDGVTYANACEAECENVEIAYEGECYEGCVCNDVYEPVCGEDGVTYANACEAECENVEIAYEGECDEGCACPEYYQPVCGVDGITYDNPCFAECEGVEIAYEGMCEDNSAIFDKFSWLNNFIFSYGSCENGITVTEYAWSSSHSFVYIQWTNGEGQLYYQDGTYYCTDETGDSCLDIYALTNTVSSWVCNQPQGPNEEIVINYGALNCNEDGTFTIDLSATGALSKSYGIYHSYGNGQPDFIFFKEDEIISFAGNTADAENGMFTAFIYDQYLADVAAKTVVIDVSKCLTPRGSDKELFNQYDWLSTVIDPDECMPGYEITEYDFGSYSFIHILANNEGNLYLGDGTYYCTDVPGYSCVEIYGFTSPTATSSCIDIMDCPDVLEPVCGADGNTYDNACYAERAGVELAYEGACSNVELFGQYPWLSTLVNPEDCDASSRISEYDLGSYSFIFIDNDDFGSLYYQDGTYYCTDGPGYSCVGLYGLPEASNVWACDGNFIHKEEDNMVNYLKFDENFKIYPNPSKGKFKVELAEPAQSLNIMNMDGRILKFLPIENHQNLIELNLTGIAKGIYMVQIQTDEQIKTQKMIIH